MVAYVDRAAMCCRHVRLRSFSNIRIAYRVILIITIVWLLILIHLAVYFCIESDCCVPKSSDYAKFVS
ncbi:hypothetical protein I4U23_009212 [Adineta vaga]|nr:hypothetical protein I4U23_009212 [Adineta vaga]